MNTQNIEDIYQQILDGKRNNFPYYVWSEGDKEYWARRVTKYLIETVLMWDADEIKKGWDMNLIKKYKLGGMIALVYKSSPYAMLNDLYPGRFKKWELKYTPSNFWTEKTALEALRWTIEEKEKLTNEELLRVYDMEWMKQHRISMPVYEYWSNNPFLMYATRIVSRTFS